MPAQALPAPVGGLNLRDARSEMPRDSALVLDNWIPSDGYVRTRGGYIEHATGLAGPVETLAYYNAGNGSPVIVAAGGGSLYDATANSSALSLASGFGRNRWQTTNANGRLLLVNGLDAPQEYDGTTMTGISPLTGPSDTSKLVGLMAFKGRMFYFEEGSQSFWYAGAGAYKGALSEFDLSFVAQRGGSIVQMFSISTNAGSGLDDYAVFIFSTGEAILYQGDNPGSTSAWTKVGTFDVGQPIGYQGHTRIGADQALITRDGIIAFRQIMESGLLGEAQLGAKVGPGIREWVARSGMKEGWQAVYHPAQSLLVFNVPISAGMTSLQYVMNTVTGAWSTFSGINSLCLLSTGAEMYHGTKNGVVMRWTGSNDNGNPITLDAVLAPQHLNNRRQRKMLTAFSLSTTYPYQQYWSASAIGDYDIPPARPLLLGPENPGGHWGDAWDVTYWSSPDDESTQRSSRTYVRGTRAVSGIGYALTLRVRLLSQFSGIRWNATQLLYTRAGEI